MLSEQLLNFKKVNADPVAGSVVHTVPIKPSAHQYVRSLRDDRKPNKPITIAIRLSNECIATSSPVSASKVLVGTVAVAFVVFELEDEVSVEDVVAPSAVVVTASRTFGRGNRTTSTKISVIVLLLSAAPETRPPVWYVPVTVRFSKFSSSIAASDRARYPSALVILS